MYVLVVTIDIKPEFKDRFVAEMLDDARGSVRNEPGCVRFDVIQDEKDSNRIYLYEVYKDRPRAWSSWTRRVTTRSPPPGKWPAAPT